MQRQTTHSCGTSFRFPVFAPGKQQCQGLLGKAAGFCFLVYAYEAAGPSGQVPAHHAGKKNNPDGFAEATSVWHWFY